jgi:protein tyrosine/serine phosphatase
MQKLFVVTLGLLFALTANASIVRFAQVTPTLYRGGQPETEADYEMLKSMGIRTIINLRRDDTVPVEQAIAERLGFRFVNLPIRGYEYPSVDTVNAALALLDDPSAGPIFLHCKHGKDRTGLVYGLYRVHTQGWSKQQAFDEMLAFGFSPGLVGLTAFFWVDPTSSATSCKDALTAVAHSSG